MATTRNSGKIIVPWSGSGWPLSLFVDQKALTEKGIYFCSRTDCGLKNGRILREPWQLTCGHRMCKECFDFIQSLLEDQRECDACKNEQLIGTEFIETEEQQQQQQKEQQLEPRFCKIDSHRAMRDNAANRELNRMRIRCPYECGTDSRLTVKTIDTHMNFCEQRLVPCEKCAEVIRGTDLPKHMLECEKKLPVCNICKHPYAFNEKPGDHMMRCVSKCPLGCSEAVKKEERRSTEHRKEQEESNESEEASSESEEARRLLQTLSIRGPAVPQNLHSEIKILLREKQIRSFQMYHEPGDIFKIVIHGTKVKSIQTNLDDLLRSRPDFTKFSITTSNIQEKKTGFSNTWIHRLSPKPCILTRDGNAKVSTIEIVLTASDKKRQRRDVTDLYAATTAHTFMSEEEIKSASPGHDFSSSFQEISKDTWLKRPFVLAPNRQTVDIIERPLPVYKYLYPSGRHDDQFLVYDMAMFKIDSKQFEDMIAAERHYPPVRESVNQVVEGLVSIESGTQLWQYVGRRIVCGGKTGVVQPQCEEETNGWVHGAQISFTLDNGKTFEDGDCGLVVYLKDTVDETKLHRYGMLIGRLTRKPEIKLAVAISFGLRKMEEVDELRVVNIQASESSSYEHFNPLNNISQNSNCQRM